MNRVVGCFEYYQLFLFYTVLLGLSFMQYDKLDKYKYDKLDKYKEESLRIFHKEIEIFTTNSDFQIPISLQSENLCYFKLKLFAPTEFKAGNI